MRQRSGWTYRGQTGSTVAKSTGTQAQFKEDTLILETAVFQAQDGSGESLTGGCSGVSHVLEHAPGTHAPSRRGIENPNAFTLIVEWDSVEAPTSLTHQHKVERFAEATTPYLAGQHEVRHVEPVG